MTSAFYERFRPLLLEQYKDAENLNLILEALSTPFEDLDQVNLDIKNLLNLEEADGAQLDLIGDIVGEKRSGRDDEEYLRWIKFRIFANTSRGFVDDVVKALKFITQATKVIYSDNPPASYTIYTDGPVVPSNINELMDKLSAAGVSLIVYASVGESPLIFDDYTIEESNLITDQDDNLVDDGLNQITVSVSSRSSTLRDLYGGEGFGEVGEVALLDLLTDTGDQIMFDTGSTLGVYDGVTQEIVGGGKLNIGFQ
jgi:hypothetical protein